MNVRWFVSAALLLMVPQYVQAQVTYKPGTPITEVEIAGLVDGSSVPAGAKITVSLKKTATDTDIKECPGQPDENVPDPVTHTWSGAGSFSPGTGTSVTWTAPELAGPATITVTATDSPLARDASKTHSVTVTVVRVTKIQYDDPDGGNQDTPKVPAALVVMKGTTVTFTAIKDPATAAWPAGKPVWGGTSGATGTGTTKSITFNETGYKTVSVECGNQVVATVLVYELFGVHVAEDNFQGRSTTRYGVAEKINLSFETDPAGISAAQIGGLAWSPASGNGTLTDNGNGTGKYTAHWKADTVTLKLTVQHGPSAGQSVSVGFTVIQPEGNRFEQKPNTGIWHRKGTPTVGFIADVYLLPKDVSFENIHTGEAKVEKKDTVVEGWFKTKWPDGFEHPANGPNACNSGNASTGCLAAKDDIATGMLRQPKPYTDGKFVWTIPLRYTVDGGTTWVHITDNVHEMIIDATAKTVKISKAGISKEVGWDDEDSNP